MNIFMGVHTNNDLTRAGVVLAGLGRLGHPGHGRLSPARLDNGWPSPGRQAVRTVMVPWLAARPLSGHAAGPATASTAPAEVDRSAPRHHGQSYRGSDPGQDGPQILTVLSRRRGVAGRTRDSGRSRHRLSLGAA